MSEIKEEESRTALLLGESVLEKLHLARVIVFGVGGVGGYVCEALVRAGVGNLTIVDGDVISLSNINRQIIATQSTVGKDKVSVMKERLTDIRPDCNVQAIKRFYLPENADSIPLDGYDYVVDAVDTVSAKIELAVRCQKDGIPLISAMGAGNKLDPTAFRVKDIFETSDCPLARTMRRELRKRNVKKLKVVCSEELPQKTLNANPDRKPTPGSVPFVPPVAGLILAGEVIKDLGKVF